MKAIRTCGLATLVLVCLATGCEKRDVPEQRRAALSDGQVLAALITVHENELAAARIAEARSSNEAVREFASRMLAEHTAAIDSLRQLASELHVERAQSTASQQIARDGRATAARITSAPPETFEATYVNTMVEGHEHVLTLIDDTLLPAASQARLRTEIGNQRTAVTSHLEHARMLKRDLDRAEHAVHEPTN